MSTTYYIPEKDNEVELPAFKKDGKPLIVPLFVCGVKIESITAKKTGEELQKISFEFELNEAMSKLPDIDLFHKDENDKYDYSRPSGETVKADVFKGKRLKGGELWKNLTKGSGKMNRILQSDLGAYGIEIPTETVEIEGQSYEAKALPELNAELFLGLPVFGLLGQESYTSKRGTFVSFIKVAKVHPANGKFEREIVITNSLAVEQVASNAAAATKKEDNPFADIDDDTLPF